MSAKLLDLRCLFLRYVASSSAHSSLDPPVTIPVPLEWPKLVLGRGAMSSYITPSPPHGPALHRPRPADPSAESESRRDEVVWWSELVEGVVEDVGEGEGGPPKCIGW
jgi:hypothetical protein